MPSIGGRRSVIGEESEYSDEDNRYVDERIY